MENPWENTPNWVLGQRQSKGRQRREDRAREMSARGFDEEEIARHLRVTVTTVRKYLSGK